MGIFFGEFGEEGVNERSAVFFDIEAEGVMPIDNAADGLVQHGVASIRAAVTALNAVYEFGTAAVGFNF
jgi:hypothetical protein